MFKNYLKIAWRNLLKNKLFSFINITGLAAGLACFLLIAVYVMDEISFDRFHANAKRIYRVHADIIFGGPELHFPFTPDMMGQALKKDYPEVEEYVRLYTSNGSKMIRKGRDFINEPKVAHADSTIFNVFTLPAISGDTRSALNDPNTVVITESAAKKYFGTTDAVGKTIETNDQNGTLYKITAVIKDIPENSHFDFDFIFSMDNVDYNWGDYLSHNFFTYLLLKEGADAKALEKKFTQYIDQYVLPQAKEVLQVQSMDEFVKAGNKLVYSLIPLTDIHLKSHTTYELRPGGNVQYVYIFSAVALFVLAIACVNFMNLTTARSAQRAREVGIRKVLGTERRNLIVQFLSEATLMALISLAIALAIAYFLLPLFNEVAGKEMTIGELFVPKRLPLMLLFPFIVGLLAGSYPAFYLSAFKPISVLKGHLQTGAKGSWLRSTLVVFQFTTSIVLIIGTIIIYRQLNYIQNKNLGFNKDQVLVINDAYALNTNADAFKNELVKNPGVLAATFSGYLPVSSSARSDNTFSKEATINTRNGFNMQVWMVDDQYIPTMGMQVIRGRNFSKDLSSDSSGVIINETAAKVLGYDNPIGKKLYALGDVNKTELIEYHIIGVVRNFHFESLKQTIGPLCMYLGRNTGLLSLKVRSEKVSSILQQAETAWKSLAPGKPFSYRFLDESFDDMYRAEQRVGKIALIFAVLTIFIACLGLFGLAAFVAERRTKEIGIRKVLGASVQSIVQMLSKDFIKLVVVSFVIAAPVSWYFMKEWLQDFAYRVSMSWWVFLLAGVVALTIALITISIQAVKAAIANPVKNLRTE